MPQSSPPVERVFGLDVHPDSFTATLVQGPTPLSAVVLNTYHKVPLAQLERWARKHATPADQLVLEASGNSFHVARCLQGLGLRVKVLESTQLGRLKEAHANNDKLSATRIAKAYLSGTAREVWVPDERTQQRRDWFHAHRKAVAMVTRCSNRLVSYLSDNGVRLERAPLAQSAEALRACLRAACPWTAAQGQLLEIALGELEHARQTEARWSSLLAQEVAQDPQLLSLVRLCGVRDVVAFAVGAVVGDIERFAGPKQLVKYVGLNPAFDQSGENAWSGGLGGHGHKVLRGLLIEAAHALFRSRHPLATWARKLLARKTELRVVVAALARKLLVSIWYLLKGRMEPLAEIPKELGLKLGKILSRVGQQGFEVLGTDRRTLRSQMQQRLLHGRTYVLAPPRQYPAASAPA